ncbi:MAG: site-specific integrase [Rikenellaceae bacterium]
MKKILSKSKDNPKLLHSTLSDGRISLYLEFYLGRIQWIDDKTGKQKVKHDRKKETLNLYLLDKPRTPQERQINVDTLKLAQEIRAEREQQLKADITGKRLKTNFKNINLYDFFQAYIDSYTKKDIRTIIGVLKRFKDFVIVTYPMYCDTLKPQQLSKYMVSEFVEYLESKSKGEGARSYYKRFKKVIAYGVEKEIISKNPCSGIVCKVDESILRKEILSIEEIKRLVTTSYPQQNLDIRRAFIFCLYTGLRHCDVKELTFGNVDFSNRLLKFEQAKTKGHSSRSGVTLHLNDGLLELIGEKQDKETLIFNLPSLNACNKSLIYWTERAEIDKHITWHCARHSFGTNLLITGANIRVVQSLLGHSDLKHTEKYTRAIDSQKEEAINNLPMFKL